VDSAADSRKTCGSERPTDDSAGGDVTPVSRRAANAKNALMRIEAKMNTKSSQGCRGDAAVNARTVFVGNVSLNVTKKVSDMSAVIDCVKWSSHLACYYHVPWSFIDIMRCILWILLKWHTASKIPEHVETIANRNFMQWTELAI